jgi:NADH:ubiquinone oxidoreductase subunit 6 (subunit J)
MTFLEALYGSQYEEIQKSGKDGNKGRLNGNVFLAAFIILGLIAVLMLSIRFVPGLNDKISNGIKGFLGFYSGKAVGKLLAIPLFAAIYLIIIKTVGNEQSFNNKVANFMQLPEDVRKKANTKILIPFFILLAIVLGSAIL